MKQNIQFTPINMETWKRREVFWYFFQMAPTGYSLTVNIDITNMYSVLKNAEIPFYPAYLWLVTKTLITQPEFTTAVKDGKVGFYTSLTPMYAVFHDDDKTFSLMWAEYREDFKEFYQLYKSDNEKYKDNHGILLKKTVCHQKTPIQCPVCHGLHSNILRCIAMTINHTISHQ